ncbi:zinc-alpha-2-glycoprotein [Misgurnus anguillicaudatus]|uniref:zinc-alpha-2-glycoprotein n=1 Tax=Misgurnus anguillicaudatus TaxID=75329 RepID=UPI003CCF50FC
MNKILIQIMILLPAVTPKGSHSLWMLGTYIKGETPFPEFSVKFMLDDVTVGYYDSEIKKYVSRGNKTDEVDVVNPNHVKFISDHMHTHIVRRLSQQKPDNQTEGPQVYQVMSLCELWDNDKGQLITKDAYKGYITDEKHFYDNILTYKGTVEVTQLYLELSKWRHEMFYYPACITTLKNYLKMRGTQVNRKVKPRVRIIHKPSLHSGGSQVSCLATGFYPRHINLTLFRDGQPLSDDEITGGDLLPNDDGTYQMRKILKISEEEQREKHKYTCTATHLSLDNKLDVNLELDHGTPLKPVLSSVLTVLGFVIVTVAAVIIWRNRAASSKSEYSSASTSEECVCTAS